MALNYRDKKSVSFTYNPDVTGNVLIRLPKPDSEGHDILRVPMESIVDFVANLIRERKKEELDQQTSLQVLTKSV